MTIFEAARWSPSAYNGQPWRFIYGAKGTVAWKNLMSVLAPFNQMWCENSSVLVLVVSHEKFDYNKKPNQTHSFDSGAAWMSSAMQAHLMGYVAHGMSGLDYKKAEKVFKIPKGYKVQMMFAIGKKDKKSKLSGEMLKMEVQSDRKKIKAFAGEGKLIR